MEWWLKNRAIRYIISGNMANKERYIYYKNNIMLHFIKKPSQWKSNSVRKKAKIY